MSFAQRLSKKLGGKWRWDGPTSGSWTCDDPKRSVRRTVGIDEYGDLAGHPRWYLYEKNNPTVEIFMPELALGLEDLFHISLKKAHKLVGKRWPFPNRSRCTLPPT